MKNQTLTVHEIIRAWKDKNFRDSLSEEQRAQLPANLAGLVEINDEQLVQVAGGLGRPATKSQCAFHRAERQIVQRVESATFGPPISAAHY